MITVRAHQPRRHLPSAHAPLLTRVGPAGGTSDRRSRAPARPRPGRDSVVRAGPRDEPAAGAWGAATLSAVGLAVSGFERSPLTDVPVATFTHGGFGPAAAF